jgi:hypothetical protein
MSDDVFNPDDFASMAADVNDTEYPVGPAGDYMAIIDSWKVSKRQNQEGDDLYPLDILWDIQSDSFRSALGRDKAIVVQTIFLDMVLGPNGKMIIDSSKGKNVQLGKLREALGQNVPGWTPGRLTGAGPALVSVTTETGKDGVTRNRIKKVGKVS